MEVNASAVRVENCRQFGGPWLALELIRRLGLDEFFERVMPRGQESVPWSVSALLLVIARLCEPSSELYIAEQWYPKTALPELLGVPARSVDDNRLYRALDQLLPHKKRLEAFLESRLGELFDLEYDLLLYDITSTYFEGRPISCWPSAATRATNAATANRSAWDWSSAAAATASSSTDPGSDIISYVWDLDNDGQYDDASGVTALFTSAVAGEYPVAVQVTDDDGASSIDSAIVTVAAVGAEVVVFEDSFEVGTWNCNWVEDSQGDWFRSTQRATDGNYSAEVDGNANDATLTTADSLDLSGYAAATLTFSWYVESGFDSDEYLEFDISVNGGLTWLTDVLRLNGNQDQESTWHHETVDLTPYPTSNLRLRFRAEASGSSEDANVDNVRLVASGVASAIAMGESAAFIVDSSEPDAQASLFADEFLLISLFAPLMKANE